MNPLKRVPRAFLVPRTDAQTLNQPNLTPRNLKDLKEIVHLQQCQPQPQPGQRPTDSRLTPVVLKGLTLLGTVGSLWFLLASSMAQVADAYTSRIAISIDRQIGESYNALIRRAEAIARTAAQRGFDSDILVTTVAVTVIGESEGSVAPLLSLEVNRDQWRSRPVPQQWITYFASARELLNLQNIADEQGLPPFAQVSGGSTVITSAPAVVSPPVVPAAPSAPPTTTPAPVPSANPGEAELVPPPTRVEINLPAAPSGQLGLPRSILR